jgi:thymidine kinase
MTQTKHNPEFTLYVGQMWSSKTTRLLMHLERYKFQQKQAVLFKPKIDDRYSAEEVVSHAGWKWPAINIEKADDIIKHLSLDGNPALVAVDEAFMITGISTVLVWLYKQGFDVAVSSLDLSSSCKPFNEITALFPWATKIEKCAAVCSICFSPAFYTHKRADDGNMISVGGIEKYEPRCFNCHPHFELQDEA